MVANNPTFRPEWIQSVKESLDSASGKKQIQGVIKYMSDITGCCWSISDSNDFPLACTGKTPEICAVVQRSGEVCKVFRHNIVAKMYLHEKQNGLFTYRCPVGMYYLVVPLSLNGRVFAQLLVGGTYVDLGQGPAIGKRLLSSLGLSFAEISGLLQRAPLWDEHHIDIFVGLIRSIGSLLFLYFESEVNRLTCEKFLSMGELVTTCFHVIHEDHYVVKELEEGSEVYENKTLILAEELTGREHEVLGLLAVGYSNRQIAGKLFISEKTVKTHVTHILKKLNVADRTKAAVYAIRNGLA